MISRYTELCLVALSGSQDIKHTYILKMADFCSVVQDTSLNLLFAGHDTSATAITLAVRHLKLHPHVLSKLRQEQQQVGIPQDKQAECRAGGLESVGGGVG